MAKKITNPEGYNQHIPDPRQMLFLSSYLDPQSPTWGNALQSGLKAGYSQDYSESITAQLPDWLKEKLGDDKLLKKAYKNLEMALDGLLDTENGSKSIQMRATETTLKGIEKAKWSDRTEVTGKNGGAIEVQQITGMQIIKELDINE